MRFTGLLLLPLLFGLVSCAGLVNTQVSAFRAETVDKTGTIFITPLTGQQAKSLEFAFYRDRLSSKLAAMGYEPVAEKEDASLLASLEFQVDKVEVDDHRIPSAYFSHGYRHSGSRYGVLLVDDGKEVQYLRTVKLVIAQNDDDQAHVYETTGQSIGRCAVLSVVFDEMLDAMLQNYPAANASVKNITIRGDTKCR